MRGTNSYATNYKSKPVYKNGNQEQQNINACLKRRRNICLFSGQKVFDFILSVMRKILSGVK